ncbi:hypothetical protein COU77_03740 [Candidatus Peregrinibacteria bacterium CG10_big_fil_rev_8_21_14_0_10_49_16]|nr:MAG: hypothetical protein COW95_02770 [Candidatus Peregrinibacteria bacterium CG22_combo_CG10-13_8_21_14_all_49_11]PIR51806.1 MAG: hypothetical protein COU77_03740 [Candidatus Peregrinibacteria bacterium CG10_big_fil_rev_8_21_14_0_10_49_16]
MKYSLSLLSAGILLTFIYSTPNVHAQNTPCADLRQAALVQCWKNYGGQKTFRNEYQRWHEHLKQERTRWYREYPNPTAPGYRKKYENFIKMMEMRRKEWFREGAAATSKKESVRTRSVLRRSSRVQRSTVRMDRTRPSLRNIQRTR